MAQLSIYDKQRHHSWKDITISIGKYDRIYITFRNGSWKRYTLSEKIAVYIERADLGAIKFDDPINNRGAIFKLKTGTGDPKTTAKTRYVQIDGNAWPGILNAARKCAGDYNLEEETTPETKPDEEETTPETKQDEPKTELELAFASIRDENAELREKLEQITKRAVLIPADKKAEFLGIVHTWLKDAQSPEERVEIWKTLAALYGIRPDPTAAQLTPFETTTRKPTDPTAGRTEGFKI